MADTETTTSPVSIEQLCHEWQVADARLKLEALEAGSGDEAVAEACERNTERVSTIFKQIEDADPPAWDGVFALLNLARHVLEEGEYSGGEPGERAATMIGIAVAGLRQLERETKGGGNG